MGKGDPRPCTIPASEPAGLIAGWFDPPDVSKDATGSAPGGPAEIFPDEDICSTSKSGSDRDCGLPGPPNHPSTYGYFERNSHQDWWQKSRLNQDELLNHSKRWAKRLGLIFV